MVIYKKERNNTAALSDRRFIAHEFEEFCAFVVFCRVSSRGSGKQDATVYVIQMRGSNCGWKKVDLPLQYLNVRLSSFGLFEFWRWMPVFV